MGRSKKKKQERKRQELERIAAEEAKKSRNFRICKGLIATAAIVGAGILSYGLIDRYYCKARINKSRKYEKNTYFEASKRGDESLRKTYLDQIISRFKPPTETNIEYLHNQWDCPNPLLKGRDMIMRTGFTAPANSEGIVKSVKTQIFRSAFEECKNEDEFLSMLVDHEYNHLMFLSGKIKISGPAEAIKELEKRAFDINGDLFEHFMELNAYHAQIQAFSKRSVREGFKRNVIESYNGYRNLVAKMEKTPAIRWILEKFPEKEAGKISFKEAKNADNESLRQDYLNQIVAQESKHLIGWKCFGRVIYDRGFKMYENDSGKKNGEDRVYGHNVPKGKKFVSVACTYIRDLRKEPNCYVSEWAFSSIVQSEDDLKFLLDNEAAHAYMAKMGHLPIRFRYKKGLLSDEMMKKAGELFSFDYQFNLLLTGRRIVSKSLKNKCEETYKPLYFEFKKLSEKSDYEGEFAKAVMQSLKVHMNERGE